MGTNFYVRIPYSLEDRDPVLCNAWNYAYDRDNLGEGTWLHLGKSSGGWCFGVHVIPELGIRTLNDWVALFDQIGIRDIEIKDEYGSPWSVSGFLREVKERSWPTLLTEDRVRGYYRSVEDFLEKNHAVRGPNNLVRSKVDGSHCVGHGDGTWDLITGEFS